MRVEDREVVSSRAPEALFIMRTARLGAKRSCGAWAAVLVFGLSASPDIAPRLAPGAMSAFAAGWPRTPAVSPWVLQCPGGPGPRAGSRLTARWDPARLMVVTRGTRTMGARRVVTPDKAAPGSNPHHTCTLGRLPAPRDGVLGSPPQCRTSLVTVGDSNGGRRRLSRRDICDHAHC